MNLYESITNKKESVLKESNNDYVVAMECQRLGYGPDQVMYDSMTVSELIDVLQDFDQNMKIVTSHDNGYTYGPIDANDFEEIPARDDDEDEEEYNESALKESKDWTTDNDWRYVINYLDSIIYDGRPAEEAIALLEQIKKDCDVFIDSVKKVK